MNYKDTMNYISKITKAQAFFQEHTVNINLLHSDAHEWADSKVRFLNTLIFLCRKHRFNYCSIIYLAINCGVTIRTVQRWLREFESDGLLFTYFRPGTTNVYHLNPAIYQSTAVNLLQRLLPSLRGLFFFSLSLVGSANKSYQSELCHPFNKTLFYNRQKDRNRIESLSKAYAREAEKSDCLSQNKKESTMNTFRREKQRADCADAIRLRLSPYGNLVMNAFPDSALSFAGTQIKAVRNRSTLAAPFRYAFKMASQWCELNSVRPDHGWIRILWKNLGWPDEKSISMLEEGDVYLDVDTQQRDSLKGKMQVAPAQPHRYEALSFEYPQQWMYKPDKQYYQESAAEMEASYKKMDEDPRIYKSLNSMGSESRSYLLSLHASNLEAKQKEENHLRPTLPKNVDEIFPTRPPVSVSTPLPPPARGAPTWDDGSPITMLECEENSNAYEGYCQYEEDRKECW